MSNAILYRYDTPSTDGLEGWGIFVIASDGYFSCVTDFGNYAHLWPPNGWGPRDFREFLCGLDSGYVAGKCGVKKVYDGEATAKSIENYIQNELADKLRGQDELNLSAQQDELDLLHDECNHVYDIEDFREWCIGTTLSAPYEFRCEKTDPQWTALWTHTWPRFVAAMRAELAKETT